MTPSPTSYHYVADEAALSGLAARIAGAGRVALDTEGDSLYHYYEKVCLLQASLDGDCYIVDPLSGLDLSRLLATLADTPLIFHGADYDLRLLRATFGFRPRRDVFDTMLAAQLLGCEQIGLAALVERHFDVALCKKGKKSDWSRRPLSAYQLQYASDDTRYLAVLADRLGAALGRLGRTEWHLESCEATVEATARDKSQAPDRAWRIKGLRGLGLRQLAFVRELWRWREREAQRADLPPFRILVNHQLVELAVWAADHPAASPSDGPRLPRTCTRRRLRALEQAIRRAHSLPEAQWPQRRKGARPAPLDRETRHRIAALRTACARLAADLAIHPAVLAPRAALEAVAVQQADTMDAIMAAGPLLRWQASLVLQAMGRRGPEAPTA